MTRPIRHSQRNKETGRSHCSNRTRTVLTLHSPTTMRFLVFSALAMCACVTAEKEYVESVRQNYESTIDDMVVKQIQKELSASYIYQAYASYFQRADVSLPGIKKFFSDASLEERDHAQQLIDYVNKRGGHAQFDKLDLKSTCETVRAASKRDSSGLQQYDDRRMCICGFVATGTVNTKCTSRDTWKEGLMAFEDALVLERYVNEQLLELHRRADEAQDAHLTHILEHDFLEEQVHAINEIGHHVTRLRSFSAGNGQNYKLGEYMFDQRLSK